MKPHIPQYSEKVRPHLGSRCSDQKSKPIPDHPCMSHDAHGRVARLHLPVAPACNLRCAYCTRRFASPDSPVPGPGTSAGILTPSQAVEKAANFVRRWGAGSVVGVSGPGDPLANKGTFETFRLLKERQLPIKTCLCTNGLILPDVINELADLGVQHLTVTMNGVTPETVSQMQPELILHGEKITGLEAAEELIQRQRTGLKAANELGIFTKVNMVVAPEINGDEAPAVAAFAASAGASVFNPMPLIPQARLAHIKPPSQSYLNSLRKKCSRSLPVFELCKQCRADAAGIPGKEKCSC